MSDISTLGLGPMGAALARSLLQAGHSVTAWNRSHAKVQPLAQLGAMPADSLSSAVAASPIVLACFNNYQTTQALFEVPEVSGLLFKKTIVQLGTGTPREARQAEAWFTSRGAEYLDGAILAGPAAIGAPTTTILYSGRQQTFDRYHALLGSLGGGTRFVSENVSSAAAI